MSQRTMLWLLGVSLALNMFFLGIVVARAWQRAEAGHERVARPGRAHPGVELRRPREGGQRWLTPAERDDLKPKRQALSQLRRDAENLLRAESFDGPAFRRSLEALRAETSQVQAAVHEVLARRAEGLDVAERRRLADAHWGGARTGKPERRGD